MKKERRFSCKDEALLRRFYGDEWEEHTDELFTTFDYSDAAGAKRRAELAGLSAEERLRRVIFEETPEWRPNIKRAEELIAAPLEMALMTDDVDYMGKFWSFVTTLLSIIHNTKFNPTKWHLEKEELDTEDGRQTFWVIEDKDSKNVMGMAYPTMARALAFLLIEHPGDITPWLDYAGRNMYDGVTGKDLRGEE